jgi:hypothetical protein
MESLLLKILHIDMLCWKLYTRKPGKLNNSNLNIFDSVGYGKDWFLILRGQRCNGSPLVWQENLIIWFALKLMMIILIQGM